LGGAHDLSKAVSSIGDCDYLRVTVEGYPEAAACANCSRSSPVLGSAPQTTASASSRDLLGEAKLLRHAQRGFAGTQVGRDSAPFGRQSAQPVIEIDPASGQVGRGTSAVLDEDLFPALFGVEPIEPFDVDRAAR